MLCRVDPSTSPFAAVCEDYDAANYNIVLRGSGSTRYSQLISSTMDSNGISVVTVRINSTVAGLSQSSDRRQSNARRSEFAVGDYIGSVAVKHPPGSAVATTVDFVAGSATAIPSVYRGVVLAYIIIGASLTVASVIGAIVWALSMPVGPKLTVLLQLLATLWTIGSLVVMGILSHQDAIDNGKSAPVFRAIGHIAIVLFGFLLFPVTKTVSLARVMGGGSSFERVIPFHVLFGVLLLLGSTVHFAGMYLEFGTTELGRAALFTWKPHSPSAGAPQPPAHYTNQLVAGFISWLFIVLLSLPAFCRNFFYNVFRISHFLFAPVALVFACLHVPVAAFVLIPGLVFYFADLVSRGMFYAGSNKILSASTSRDYTAARLDIQVSDKFMRSVKPGQYVFLSTSFVGSPILKPFSVAHTSLGQLGIPSISLYIKNQGRFTAQLVSAIAEEKWKDQTATLLGTYGTLSVDPAKRTNIIMISGGIGVTPMLSMLQALVRTAKDGNPPCAQLAWIWVVREADLVVLFAEALNDLLTQNNATCNVYVRIYLTKEANGGALPSTLAVHIRTGRPDLNSILFHHGTPENANETAVYTCGPGSLTQEVSTLSAGYGYGLHCETFAFGGAPSGMATSMKTLCAGRPAPPSSKDLDQESESRSTLAKKQSYRAWEPQEEEGQE